MTDAILVLNAGSSSIKFSLFSQGGPELAPVAGGQVEGIYTEPRCLEGNYGLPGLLHGRRLEEALFAQGKGPNPATRDAIKVIEGDVDPLQ